MQQVASKKYSNLLQTPRKVSLLKNLTFNLMKIIIGVRVKQANEQKRVLYEILKHFFLN